MNNQGRIAELAGKARQGSPEAFNELYHLTRDRAYFVALTITRNEQDALDILQDSYLKAWQSISSLQKPEQFPAWLRQITGNTAKNYIKHHSPLLFTGSDDGTEDLFGLQEEKDGAYIPDAAMDTAETRRLIMKIVDELPQDQRLCVLMYYYEDMGLPEIAAALDIPQSTVTSRLYRARKRISDGVEELERKGTKLYSAAPLPLLIWMLRKSADETVRNLPPLILGGSAAAVGAGAATGATIAGIALPKVIAGIAAAVILTGGVTTAAVLSRRAKQPIGPTGFAETLEYATTAEAFLFPLPAWPAAAQPEAAGEPPSDGYNVLGAQTPAIPPAGSEVSPANIPAPNTPAPNTPQPNTPQPNTPQPNTPQPGAQPPTTASPPTTPAPTPPAPPLHYTVTYNYAQNGGSSATKSSISQQSNSAADLLPTATKPGWEFVGWNTDKNAHTRLESCRVLSDTTLYAIFRKQVTARFYSLGANDNPQWITRTGWRYNNESAAVTISSPVVETFTAPNPPNTPLTFQPFGWALPGDKADGTRQFAQGATISLAGDQTYWPIYQIPTPVDFYVDSALYRSVSVIMYCVASPDGSAAYGIPTYPTAPSPPPARPGATFVCWRNDAGNNLYPGSGSVTGGGPYHAVWKPN